MGTNLVEQITSNTNTFDFNSLLAALIGGLISLVAVFITEYLTRKRTKSDELELTQNFLKNIKEEINTLWQLYISNMGDILEQHNETEAFHYIYVVNQDYFTIYNNSSQLIGSVKNKKLSSSIIKTYAKAKSLIDTYQLNNKILDKQEIYASDMNISMINGYENALKEYTPVLKRLHTDLKEEISTLNNLFESEKI